MTPMPDQIDIFIHNHRVLTRGAWLFVLIAGIAVYNHLYPHAIALLGMSVVLRSMSILLCGWVHNWAAYHVEIQKSLL